MIDDGTAEVAKPAPVARKPGQDHAISTFNCCDRFQCCCNRYCYFQFKYRVIFLTMVGIVPNCSALSACLVPANLEFHIP